MTSEPTPAEAYVETRAARWEAMRAACESFYEENGMWPHTSSNDPAERRLGEWLGRMRSQGRRETLPEAQRTALDAMSRRVGYDWALPRHLPTGQGQTVGDAAGAPVDRPDRWAERLAAAEAFFVAYHRWPRGGGEEPAESDLGWWLARQRQRRRDHALSEEHGAALDALSQRVGQDWRTQPRDPDADSRPHRAYAVSAEGKAGRQRAQDSQWEIKRATLESFYVRMGRWPRRNAVEEVEHALAAWHATQRSQQRRGDLDPARLDALTQMSRRLRADWMTTSQPAEQPAARPRSRTGPEPGQASPRRQQAWETKRASVEAFYLRLGRWPHQNATDPVERSLASWLGTQRVVFGRGALPGERLAALTQMAERLGVPWTAQGRWRRSAPPEFYTEAHDLAQKADRPDRG